MGIIKAKDLVHEYIRRDEEGNVESIQTALDTVSYTHLIRRRISYPVRGRWFRNIMEKFRLHWKNLLPLQELDERLQMSSGEIFTMTQVS